MPGYRCGDDDFFNDGGGSDGGGDGGDGYNDQGDDDQDQYDDGQDDQGGEDGQDDESQDDQQAAGGGDDGGDGGDDGDYEYNDDDFPEIDNDVYASAEDFPNADEEDFEDDTGDWSDSDYQESAVNLFGGHEFFGDTIFQQKAAEGFTAYQDPNFARGFDSIAPGTSENLHLFERGGQLFAFGFVSAAVLEMLAARYSGINLSNVDVAVPQRGEPYPPQALPPAIANIQEAPAVDLRKYCTPVADQAQTSRCSAFAWTHATEMTRNILNEPPARLSPTFTMWEFQQMQGDARDYRWAWKGGDGTNSGPEPGNLLMQYGTCRQELWPDDSPQPRAREEQLVNDAQNFRLEGAPWPIGIDDVRKVLTAGYPVHVSMNTGTSFSNVGRDGLFNAAEAPSGQHGRHAMLIVGYTGNFFIVKNSWGTDWGDQGYCYIPKKVLAESDPELIAVILKKATA